MCQGFGKSAVKLHLLYIGIDSKVHFLAWREQNSKEILVALKWNIFKTERKKCVLCKLN